MKNRFLILSFLFLLISCGSVPKFQGNGDMCGVVVDDFNRPIKDFAVTCRNQLLESNKTFTNESGIFVFHDMPSGIYTISGMKNDFLRLEETKFIFSDRSKIFCCQVLGIDTALDKIENLILLKEYEAAFDVLKAIQYVKSSNEETVIKYYRNILQKKIKEQKNDKKKKTT